MAHAVPGIDFKVAYYDKYSGISVTRVLTITGMEYLFEKNDSNKKAWTQTIPAGHVPVFAFTTPKFTLAWLPTRDKENLFYDGGQGKIKDILESQKLKVEDHQASLDVIVSTLETEQNAPVKGGDTVKVFEDNVVTIYHARTFEAFQKLFPTILESERQWQRAMQYSGGKIFVIKVVNGAAGPFLFAIDKGTGSKMLYDQHGKESKLTMDKTYVDAVMNFEG